MAKRKQKNEIDITSIEQQNKEIIIENNSVNKEIIDNKESKENKENTDNKTNDKTNDKIKENKENYIITKKSEGVYIRKLRRL